MSAPSDMVSFMNSNTLNITAELGIEETAEAIRKAIRLSVSDYLHRSYASTVNIAWEGHVQAGHRGSLKSHADSLFSFTTSSNRLGPSYGVCRRDGGKTYATLYAKAAYMLDISLLPASFETTRGVLSAQDERTDAFTLSASADEDHTPNTIDLARALVPLSSVEIARSILCSQVLTMDPYLDKMAVHHAVGKLNANRFQIEESTLRPYDSEDFFIALDSGVRYELPPRLAGEVMRDLFSVPAFSR